MCRTANTTNTQTLAIYIYIYSPPARPPPFGGRQQKFERLAHSGPPVGWFLACLDFDRKGVQWRQRWPRDMRPSTAVFVNTWMSCRRAMFPLLSVTMRFFCAGGMTGGSGVHPLGLVRVPVMAPPQSLGRSEWQPHSSAMDGSRTGQILGAAWRDGHCGEEGNLGAV